MKIDKLFENIQNHTIDYKEYNIYMNIDKLFENTYTTIWSIVCEASCHQVIMSSLSLFHHQLSTLTRTN